MSDWVADLIHDAIMYNRVEPRNMPRPIPVQPSVVQPQQIPQSHPLQMPQSQQLQQEVPPVQMNKKKLEKIADELDGENSYPPEAPPWSSPPFWVKTQNK
ncbi:MAG: hypothetical protein JW841_10115 [Deltaproteobacteria bacterium]|nr:hypothetical protein [Deltaproteobacteria bacterium]